MVEVERRRKRFEARQVTEKDFASADRLCEVAEWASNGSSVSAVICRVDPVYSRPTLRVWPRADRSHDWADAMPGDWLIKRRKRLEILSAEEFEQRYDAHVLPVMEATAEPDHREESDVGVQVLALSRSEGRVYYTFKSHLSIKAFKPCLMYAKIAPANASTGHTQVLTSTSSCLCTSVPWHGVNLPSHTELQSAVSAYIESHKGAL
jgi:hypothetical protein